MAGPTTQRVPGHTLVGEGRGHDANGVWSWDWGIANGEGRGRCSCGALSPMLPTRTARKRWHREHKGEVIASQRGVA